ncbi:unnamed protein product [Brassica oleracea]
MGSKVLGLELSSRIKSDESERRKAPGLLQTLLHEDGVNPCKETIERCFIWSVPPECLNEGVVFKEWSVVDAYFNNGWWTGVVVVGRPDGSFLVYFDDPPDIMRFIRSQLIPHADWIGSEWVKSKNKVLSQHMFRTGKLVEMTREISEKDAVLNYTEIRLSMEWLGGGSWIRAHKREFENNAATPIRSAQERPSNTLVLESNEDDTVNDDATEITSSRESHSNTSVLEATETETQNHETIDVMELPLPYESDDMMDDVATPIIDPQEIPRGETMSKSDDKIALPKRISEPGTDGGVLKIINKRSNLKLVGKKCLWFSFGEQLMRFSLREFHLATGLPCVVDKDEEEVETSGTKNKKKDRANLSYTIPTVSSDTRPWMNKNQTLNTLLKLLVEKKTELTADQRLRLGATILVEGILMASNPGTSIQEEHLLRARNFKEFCKYPWGNLAFDYLRKEVESFTYTKDDEIQFPLCLHWIETKSLTIEEVDVKCILGDPELHSDLVEDVDYWLNGSVDIAVAEAEVDENNSAHGIDATDQEKIEFLTKKVVSLKEKVKYLESLLNIRGETVKKSKETEAATKTKNADYEVGDTEGKKNEVRPQCEVDHQEEDDTEVEHGAKESDTSKVNEEQPQEEEEHQEEDDTEVDVDDSAKGNQYSETNKGQTQEEEEQQPEDDTEVNADVDVGAKGNENSETNEDGGVNEDASKKSVKVAKKRGRGNKGMKKGVTPPSEVQQQVEDDAEVDAKESENPEANEDGEVNEDASKKPVKFTKKREGRNKEPNVDTSKSKGQKKQSEKDSAGDVIGRVLEDLKKAD